MKNHNKFLLFCIISLLFCLASVSASDVQSNDTQSISKDVTLNCADIATTNNNIQDNTKNIIKTDKNQLKESSDTITVTKGNYGKYFETNSLGNVITTDLVKSGSTINLQGTFDDVNFAVDKKSLTLTSLGKKAKLTNCIVYSYDTSSGSKISNLTITNTKDSRKGIILDHSTNVIVENNNVQVAGYDSFALTAYNINKCIIRNNYLESNHTQSNMVIYSSENNTIFNNTVTGYANCIYLCAYGGDVSNNNIIRQNKVIGKSPFSTCYTIQLMGNNNIVEKNTVSGGFRGISSENSNIIRDNDVDAVFTGIYTQENSTITNNNIHVSGDSYGINVRGKKSIIKNNIIKSDYIAISIDTDDVTISNNDITSKEYSIYTTDSFTGIKLDNNDITGELYNTGTMTLNENTINSTISNKGKIIASNNIFTDKSNSFKLNSTSIRLVNDGNFIPENAEISIYENNKLVKKTSMADSEVNYAVPSGIHYYGVVVTNTSINSFKNNTFEVNNENRTQLRIAYNTIKSAKVNTNVNISGKLLDNQKGINDETIIITVNNKQYTTKTANGGVFSINYVSNAYGTQNVVFTHKESDKYQSSKNTTTFTVFTPTKIQLNKISNTKYGNSVKISGKLLANNSAVKDSKVKIKVNTKTYIVTTTSTGAFTLNYKTSIVGTNNVTATFAANDKYLSTSTKATFNVLKQNLQLTVSPTKQVAYGAKATITGKFQDKTGKILGNTNIKLNINGKTYTVKTNSTGVYTYKYKTSVVGTNNVTASYAGNKNYNKVTTKNNFKVIKQNLTLTINSIKSVAYGENIKITGKFQDKNGKLLGNINIKLNVNGKQVSVKTNAKGVYTYTVKATKVGTNTVTASFAGNKNYNKISTKKTVKINKQSLKLTVNATKQVKKGSKVTITGLFTDKHGKILANSGLKVNLNGKVYSVKTNNKGIYKTTIVTNKIGTNNVTVSFAGNNNYNKVTAKKTFNVVK